ncbi:uncharacterized protein NDAI_0G02090 [Naumovozyma dairenensis CBS 421]|uniref:Uncharacterized protein n=1 Tax=Naumovozyma dairenensis (strain ATCC 10597 / BCRC 20456 / CBS 421 / NBRC 0211 / NRRL Y-12639) TaxID=1071378 RepID=G0WDX3_NAUDC|nr:hypothetical protein NDAI_0G02090 [Naumovozyma dairenensis CBS 421]CCD25984.2 hypothetical protein NDAI_0G02090 [Naumovozyma dairenensis CBS 421]
MSNSVDIKRKEKTCVCFLNKIALKCLPFFNYDLFLKQRLDTTFIYAISLNFFTALVLLFKVGQADAIAASGPLPRDGTTKTDTYNVLRCMQLLGVSNTTIIATSEVNDLVVFHNRTIVNMTCVVKVTSRCYLRYGYEIAMENFFYAEFPSELTRLGTLGDVLDGNVDLPEFKRFDRMKDPRNSTEAALATCGRTVGGYYATVFK